MSRSIKKGISYVAFGFLFILVNINLIINGVSINIVPDCIGWLLMFLAFDKLGDYVSGKRYLKWAALVIAVVTGAVWLASIFWPRLDIRIVKTVLNVAEAVFMFLLMGVLVKIAADAGSSLTGTLRFLRYFNFIIFILLSVSGLLAASANSAFVGLFAVIGIAALITAVFTAIVLFMLRKDIKDTEEPA